MFENPDEMTHWLREKRYQCEIRIFENQDPDSGSMQYECEMRVRHQSSLEREVRITYRYDVPYSLYRAVAVS
jgi:hypothetical protein